MAYLAQAQAGLNGSFATSYRVSAGPGHGSTVYGAQLSHQVTVYRETPPLTWFGPGPDPRSYEVFEVYAKSSPVAGVGNGLYSCTLAASEVTWACQGPYKRIGMGGTFELTAPYPPPELFRGLANAAYTYLSLASVDRRPSQLAYFFPKDHQRCIGFGSQRHFVGSACLGAHNLVTYYQLRRTATVDTYVSATLLSFVPHAGDSSFRLPAPPVAVRS